MHCCLYFRSHKDELSTTSRSYDGQLSMMSGHLAGMNEKLAQQKVGQTFVLIV